MSFDAAYLKISERSLILMTWRGFGMRIFYMQGIYSMGYGAALHLMVHSSNRLMVTGIFLILNP